MILLRHAGLRSVALEWINEANYYHPENQQIQEIKAQVDGLLLL